MIIVEKPVLNDLQNVERILSQWTEKEEVDKYVKRIRNEMNGKTEFNMHFWVVKEGGNTVGVSGLSDPMPNTLPFAKSGKPVEIKIMYVDGSHQGKGVGRVMIGFLEAEAKKQGFDEVMARSAKRYKFSAWGFYKKMGYQEAGELPADNGKEIMQVFSKLL